MPLARTMTAMALAAAVANPPGPYVLPERELHLLRRQLGEMHVAARGGDDARVVAYTYGSVVKRLGGPAGALEAVAELRERMKADGAEVYRFEITDAPPSCVRSADRLQCVVEGAQYLRIAGRAFRGDTQTLAFSDDGGRHWTFVGVVDPAAVRVELPELSAELQLKSLDPPRELTERRPDAAGKGRGE